MYKDKRFILNKYNISCYNIEAIFQIITYFNSNKSKRRKVMAFKLINRKVTSRYFLSHQAVNTN